jgi:methanogenic corrinoid protein MtbC1
MEMETNYRRNDMEMRIERERGSMEIENQRQKSAMDIEATKQKNDMAVNAEQDKVAAKTGAPTTQNIKAFEEIAKGFKEGMEVIAKAMTEPKQITVQRNNAGQVTGATAV